RAVENVEPDLGFPSCDGTTLHGASRLEPVRWPPLVDRLVVHVADGDAVYFQAVLVGIKRAECLSEGLADAVTAVRPQGYVHADFFAARVKSDGMIGGCEYDTLHARPVGGLEQVVAAHDVGTVDRLPGPFD